MRTVLRGMRAALCLLVAAGPASIAGASDVETERSAAPVAGVEPVGEPVVATAPGWVERAALTTAVVDREPQDSVESLTNDHAEIYFFTELRGLEGHTVTHRWEHQGAVVAEVPMEVGGPRWRTYSRKQLAPGALGTWKVSVVDGAGQVLETRSFVLSDAVPSGMARETDAGPAPEALPAAPQP